MYHSSDNTITAGELAELFNIPKQTLLYYDKIDVLKPEYISGNGYRHYSVKQYMILEVILNLRKMNIPMTEIRDYLEHRSTDNLEKLLQRKFEECNAVIAQKERIKEDILVTCHQIHKIRRTCLDQFSLSFRPEKTFCISKVDALTEGSARFKIFAQHNNIVFSKQHFKEKAVGWIVPSREFLAGANPLSVAFFSTIKKGQRAEALPPSSLFVRPAGLYATVRFKGTYYQNNKKVAVQFRDFLCRNQLEPTGDAYVMPLKNHWMTSETNEYINQISMQVTPK